MIKYKKLIKEQKVIPASKFAIFNQKKLVKELKSRGWDVVELLTGSSVIMTIRNGLETRHFEGHSIDDVLKQAVGAVRTRS